MPLKPGLEQGSQDYIRNGVELSKGQAFLFNTQGSFRRQPGQNTRKLHSWFGARATAAGGAGARIAVLGPENLYPDVYLTAGPCSNTSLQRNLGLCRGL